MQISHIQSLTKDSLNEWRSSFIDFEQKSFKISLLMRFDSIAPRLPRKNISIQRKEVSNHEPIWHE